jgi:hypothetical protein
MPAIQLFPASLVGGRTSLLVVKKMRGLPFLAGGVYIGPGSPFGRKAGSDRTNSKIELNRAEDRMDQVVEQVVDTKEEVTELSLAELAQVGGGAAVALFN